MLYGTSRFYGGILSVSRFGFVAVWALLSSYQLAAWSTSSTVGMKTTFAECGFTDWVTNASGGSQGFNSIVSSNNVPGVVVFSGFSPQPWVLSNPPVPVGIDGDVIWTNDTAVPYLGNGGGSGPGDESFQFSGFDPYPANPVSNVCMAADVFLPLNVFSNGVPGGYAYGQSMTNTIFYSDQIVILTVHPPSGGLVIGSNYSVSVLDINSSVVGGYPDVGASVFVPVGWYFDAVGSTVSWDGVFSLEVAWVYGDSSNFHYFTNFSGVVLYPEWWTDVHLVQRYPYYQYAFTNNYIGTNGD